MDMNKRSKGKDSVPGPQFCWAQNSLSKHFGEWAVGFVLGFVLSCALSTLTYPTYRPALNLTCNAGQQRKIYPKVKSSEVPRYTTESYKLYKCLSGVLQAVFLQNLFSPGALARPSAGLPIRYVGVH